MKAWVLRHPRIERLARKVFRPTPKLVGLDYGMFLAEQFAQKHDFEGIDCVVGIPRSGLMFASIIATKRGLPLSTPECFTQGIVWQASARKAPRFCEKILLIDDATGSGSQMDAALKALEEFDPALEIETASLLVTRNGAKKVDSYVERLSEWSAFAFEWNIAHADLSSWGPTCVDMDGVLCNGGSCYLVPNFEVKAVITSRPEARRQETEKWLKENGVRYGALVMLDGDRSAVDHKVDALKRLRPWWYWESSRYEAKWIAKKAGIPVLCIEDMRVYRP